MNKFTLTMKKIIMNIENTAKFLKQDFFKQQKSNILNMPKGTVVMDSFGNIILHKF